MMKIFIASLLFLAALVNLAQARVGCDVARPCQNGGTCENDGRCNCQDLYFGEFCQYNSPCYRQCPNDTRCVRYGDKTKCEELPCMNVADIGIVLDCSGSINKRNFRIMLATVRSFINHFQLGADRVQVALFAFNDTISERHIELNELNDNKKFLEELAKFGKEHTGGGTRTDLAIYELMSMFNATRGDRPDAPNLGFLFTDGKSNFQQKTKDAANDLHTNRPDINMFCIGIGSGVDEKELETIASKKENVIITDFKKLPKIVQKLVNQTCVKDLCSSNPCKNNGVCKVVLDTFICDCPPGYSGERCLITCDTHYDVIVIFDESGSISKRKFNQMIDGVLYFVRGLDIDSGKVRVGIITYATNVFIAFDLNTFHDKVHMIFIIDLLRYRYRGGLTNTHKVLFHLIHYGYTPSSGDRKYVPNYAFIITDGKSRRPWLTKKYAKELQAMKVYMYALGVGPKVNKREIFYLSSKPKRHHMFFSSFESIPISILRVKVEVCADFTPVETCIRCKGPRQCPSCMGCCKGCCRDKVTLLS